MDRVTEDLLLRLRDVERIVKRLDLIEHSEVDVIHDVLVNPAVVKLPGVNPPASDNKDGFPMLRFDRQTEESAYFQWELPEGYKGAGEVEIEFDFIVENPPVTPAGDEAVAWGVEYKDIEQGEVFDFTAGTTTGTVTETLDEDETAEIYHETSDIALTTTGWSAGTVLLFRFYRDATNPADTYDNEVVRANNDAWLFDIHLKYECDKHGGPV